jgi:hypothetical protein
VSNSHLINSRTPKPRSPMDFGSPHLYSRVISRATPSRSDGPRDFAKLPRDYKSSIFFFLRSYREISDRGFLLHNLPYYRNSDDQNADGARPFCHLSPQTDGYDCTGVFLRCSRLFPSARHASSLLLRSPPLMDLTVGSHSSGFRGSRLRMARVSCIRKPRYAEPRLFGILCHVSLLLDGSDPFGKSRIAIS